MAKLAFFWPHDLDGYRIVKKVPKPRKSGRPVPLALEGSDQPTTEIVAKRERNPEFRDVLKIDRLLWRLAELDGKPRPENAKGALEFVQTYGFLKGPHGPESVESIVRRIRAARSVVRTIKHKDWPTLQRWAIDNASKIQLHPQFTYFEDEDWSDLFFGPKTFIDAIYLQALDDVAAGTEFERCDNPGCPEWFRVGPGTGHSRVRRERRFHSPTCQKAFAYRLKKGEIK